MLDIVKLQFGFIQKRVAKQNIHLTASDEVLNKLAKRGFDPQYGARPVKRLLQKEVLNSLSKDILAGKVQPGDHAVLDVFDDRFVFRKPIKEEEVK